jgi:muramoyltetrapeptide carboxypeptidase
MELLKPKALRRGDMMGVVAPAGPVDRQRIDRALSRLRERGFHVKTYGDIYRSEGYLAGDDATRADELMTAFADPATTGVWCARGGYGVARILDRLDFSVIRNTAKVFVGFSDITALHIAIQQCGGLKTFHGPNLQDGFGKVDDMPAANEAALWQALLAEEQTGAPRQLLCGPTAIESIELERLAPGVASGPLIGGNLAVLCGLMGTPFEIQTEDRILFIEDVSERAYRIDRYLAQLALAGKLQSAAGILVGSFSYDDGDPSDSPSAIMGVFRRYLADLNIPVIVGFPAGHEKYNLTLPEGGQVTIDADAGRIFVEAAVVS